MRKIQPFGGLWLAEASVLAKPLVRGFAGATRLAPPTLPRLQQGLRHRLPQPPAADPGKAVHSAIATHLV